MEKGYQETLVTLSREALDNLPFGVYVVDKEGKILFFNSAMARISGVEEGKKIEGQNVFEVPTYKKYGLLEFVKRGLSGKPFTIKGIQYISHVGKKESFRDYYGIPIKNEEGVVEKLLCLVEDTTQRRELESQVVQEIEEKEKLLTEFRDRVDRDMERIKVVLENTKSYLKTKLESPFE